MPSENSLSVQSQQGKKLFVFDRVFDENTTQDGIWDYVSDSVSSFVRGYNVSILAYGQSGAGKSYTMGTSGPEDQNDPEVMGIVPRAAQALFEKLNGATSRQSGIMSPKRYSTQGLPTLGSLAKMNGTANKNWELKATYVEIYNEHLRDLLVPEGISQTDRSQVAIREDTKGRILLTGLNQVPINSVEDLLRALNFGSAIRQTDATAINARSSRSHAVFSLNLVQRRYPDRPGSPTSLAEKRMSMPIESMAENVVTIDSKLHFVDLAGSERLKNTGATGERAKEGISINQGLASLGKVISQLSSKHGGSHISYRDSKLTRLLQDSLGGNAITYMVACVTPAVFHLSETLNTVTYAQRARAIQSKPEIQQTHEDGDKQAAIDRLRAEVSYLRDQIKSDRDRGENSHALTARSDRLKEREAELQAQLADMQESYDALSQRHTKLISELSKARESDETETPLLKEALGENATERIKRSSSFAQAVEQMVMEYEKTIKSLESSLTKTRASLSNSETTLLEKETRIAYMETIQQQLQARVQKAADREMSNDEYLQDLERRMEGSATGEERNVAVIAELRRELARLRESENSAEDYISTLEDRLAEAEQDQEAMQQELDRLEHVIEKQRSLGRLHNLLGQLDGDKQRPSGTADHDSLDVSSVSSPPSPQMNGSRYSYDPFRPRSETVDAHVTKELQQNGVEHSEDVDSTVCGATEEQHLRASAADPEPRSPAQDDFMADKLENLTQELFELRSDHETNLIDYENLQQKYQTALETLAKLEYGKETPASRSTPTPSRPNSFLANAGMKEEEKASVQGQPSSSRSLSADLSSHGRANSIGGANEDEESREAEIAPMAVPSMEERPDMAAEMEVLKKLHAEKEVSVNELTNNYKRLAHRHESTLQEMEALRLELQRAQSFRPSSPSLKSALRRKSEDALGTDRASRSFASLKNMALERFEEEPEFRHGFELHLNSVMSELSNRTERSHALEAELATARRELEGKAQLITGLTRERATLAASPTVDFSVVGQMREQLEESENQIRSLHEQHASREKELQDQIAHLKKTLADHQKAAVDSLPTPLDEGPAHVPGDFPQTPAAEDTSTRRQTIFGEARAGAVKPIPDGDPRDEITRLQEDLVSWEGRHDEAMDAMKASEAKLLETIADLEESLRKAEQAAKTNDRSAPEVPGAPAAAESLEQERQAHNDIVAALQKEVEHYRSTADGHVSRLQELEQAYAAIVGKVEEDSTSRDLTAKELQAHKDLVANLENQLQVHKSSITMHQDTLESLQATHGKAVEELNNSLAAAEQETKERCAQLEEHHALVVANMQADLNNSQKAMSDLLRNASAALGYETDPKQLPTQIRGLVEEGKELHTRHLKTTNELKAVQEELQKAMTKTVDLENKIGELKMINEEAILNLEKISEKEKKSARLVEELEEQLNNNFDSHQRTNHRLSTMQSETVQVRMELERELEEQKMRCALLEVSRAILVAYNADANSEPQQQLNALKRQSSVSTTSGSQFNRESLSPEAAAIALARSSSQASARKSANGGVLPTPPPSIPLPPLPGTPNSQITATPPLSGGLERATSPIQRVASPVHENTPPGSRHASRDAGPGMSQLLEEQEGRIRTIEKHLFAEKQLTATLEEALVDLETSANRTKSEMETWRKKCTQLEDELVTLRKEKTNSRASIQAVEEEREMRMRAERARQALEQRMMELNASKKKKKNALNCF